MAAGTLQRRKVNAGRTGGLMARLQEGKRSLYEGGIRVPTVISGPMIQAGAQCDVPIVQWDFLPTFHDLSGSESPLPEGVDGGSLRDVFHCSGNSGRRQATAAPGIVHHYTRAIFIHRSVPSSSATTS